MIPVEAKKIFLTKFASFGSDKFYKFLIDYANDAINSREEILAKNPNAIIGGLSPEAELLEYYDKFVILYRKEKDNVYLDIAKLFRRAANKIYRTMLKKEIIEKDNKFLNMV